MNLSRYSYLLMASCLLAAAPLHAQTIQPEVILEGEVISAAEEAEILLEMEAETPLTAAEAAEVIAEAIAAEAIVEEPIVEKVQEPIIEALEEVVTTTEEAVVTTIKEPEVRKYPLDNALKGALSRAYNKNPELEAQRRAFQGTVERVPQALAGALPSANLSYSRGRQRTQTPGTTWSSTDSQLKSLSVVQPLFRGGTTYANTKAARRQVDAAMERLTQVEQGVLLQAITAYVEVVRTHAVFELSKKNRAVLDRQREAATQRFEVGEDTRTDVAQSEARLALAESDVINSKGQLESAKAIYFEVVGEQPTSMAPPRKLPEAPKSLEHFIALALEYSPIVQEAKFATEAADYNVNANIGTLLPSVNLEGTMSRQEGAGTFGTTDFDRDGVVVSATLPLFAGGARYSQIRQAKETYQQSRFQLVDVKNQVRRQAVGAWEDLQAATATIKSNKLAIEAAQVALEGVRQEQQYGSRTTLDVLDAERELFNTEVQLVIAERNEVVAAYSVLAVLGRLTAENMGLDVPLYDAEGYYDDTEYQFIGF